MPCSRSSRLLAVAVAVAAAGMPASAGVEDDLARRWEGAWVIVDREIGSACTSIYTDNEVRGDLVVAKGEHRFAAGELANVQGVDLHRAKVDVLLDLVEPVLAAYQDGPFTLYHELSCRVELEIPRPPSTKDLAPLDALVAGLLERHPDALSARRSPDWNRRVRESYPRDYEQTLAAHRVWKAEQVNAAVAERRDQALEEAGRLLDGFRTDPDYREGFAEGIEEAQDEGFGSCESLLSAGVYGFVDSPPSGKSHAWRDGFADGQALVFHVEVGRRLEACFVPVPPAP